MELASRELIFNISGNYKMVESHLVKIASDDILTYLYLCREVIIITLIKLKKNMSARNTKL